LKELNGMKATTFDKSPKKEDIFELRWIRDYEK